MTFEFNEDELKYLEGALDDVLAISDYDLLADVTRTNNYFKISDLKEEQIVQLITDKIKHRNRCNEKRIELYKKIRIMLGKNPNGDMRWQH